MPLFINNLTQDINGFPPSAGGGPRLLATPNSDEVVLAPGNTLNWTGGVWGLEGNDTLLGSFDSNERLIGGPGNDSILGAPGNDILMGGRGGDVLDGNEANDFIRGDLDSDDLYGRDGNDIIRGGQGNDSINGGNGNDFLVGDLGTDDLTGGEGADTFVFRSDNRTSQLSEADLITDFSPSQGDKIGLTNGLTENDIDFTETADVNGDGVFNDAVIKIKSSGAIIGIVGNIENRRLVGNFIPASSFAMNLTGSEFQFLP